MKFQKLTDSQKQMGAVLFVLTVGLSVLLVTQTNTDQSPAMAVTTQAHAELSPVATLAATPESQVSPQIEAVNTIPMNAVADNLSSVPAQASWQMAGVKAETPAIPLSEKISDYAVVSLPKQTAAFPVVGEHVLLPMLHGKTLVATVGSVTHLPNGDYSWSGHLQGYGTDYPVVMTYGEHSVFATITTPEGSYTMESINGLGWLYKNPAEIELSHPGAKDFLEITTQH